MTFGDAPAPRDMPFVDCHHHLWDLDRFDYGWLKGSPAVASRLGDYRMIQSGIGRPERALREFFGANTVRSVHVEAGYSGPDPVVETVWLDQVSAAFGFPNALIVAADLSRPDVTSVFERHLEASLLTRGVRARLPAELTSDFRRGYAALGQYGLLFEFAGPGRLADAVLLASAHPDVKLVLEHGAFPLAASGAAFRTWRTELREFAAFENVICKVSGFGMSDHGWTVETLRPWVAQIVETFGTERVVFGSNWPIDLLYGPYIAQVGAFRQILADLGLSSEERRRLLHGNAERTYRL